MTHQPASPFSAQTALEQLLSLVLLLLLGTPPVVRVLSRVLANVNASISPEMMTRGGIYGCA